MDSRRTLIYLLRHGDVVDSGTRRFIGHLDVPLSALGERQCARQAERLQDVPFAAVLTSDLVRARVSGALIAGPHRPSLRAVPALREMAMGRWEGLTAAEIEAREPEAFSDWMSRIGEFPFPEGESVPDLAARAWPAFVSIAREFAGRTVAVVAHGGTNRAIICRALDLPLSRLLSFGQDYAALTVLEHARGRWSVIRLNEAPMV